MRLGVHRAPLPGELRARGVQPERHLGMRKRRRLGPLAAPWAPAQDPPPRVCCPQVSGSSRPRLWLHGLSRRSGTFLVSPRNPPLAPRAAWGQRRIPPHRRSREGAGCHRSLVPLRWPLGTHGRLSQCCPESRAGATSPGAELRPRQAEARPPSPAAWQHLLTRNELVQVHLLTLVFVHVQHEEA